MILPLRTSSERILRRAFHLYWRMSRGLTLGVRGVVVNAAGDVFLVKHSYVPGWHFPGGGVEPGETLDRALARELEEEGSIAVTGPARLHGVFFNAHVSDRDHVAVYLVRDFQMTGTPITDREIIESGFFPRHALPQETTRATRARLAEIFDGRALTAEW